MARRPKIPDPRDRSPKRPTRMLKADVVLDIYNQDHPEDQRQNVTEAVKNYVAKKALEGGWNEVIHVESEIVLKADVRLHPNPETG